MTDLEELRNEILQEMYQQNPDEMDDERAT